MIRVDHWPVRARARTPGVDLALDLRILILLSTQCGKQLVDISSWFWVGFHSPRGRSHWRTHRRTLLFICPLSWCLGWLETCPSWMCSVVIRVGMFGLQGFGNRRCCRCLWLETQIQAQSDSRRLTDDVNFSFRYFSRSVNVFVAESDLLSVIFPILVCMDSYQVFSATHLRPIDLAFASHRALLWAASYLERPLICI